MFYLRPSFIYSSPHIVFQLSTEFPRWEYLVFGFASPFAFNSLLVRAANFTLAWNCMISLLVTQYIIINQSQNLSIEKCLYFSNLLWKWFRNVLVMSILEYKDILNHPVVKETLLTMPGFDSVSFDCRSTALINWSTQALQTIFYYGLKFSKWVHLV